MLPSDDGNYPQKMVNSTTWLDDAIKKFAKGEVLKGKYDKEELGELFAALEYVYRNPSTGNTCMIIEGGHRLFALFLVRLNILPFPVDESRPNGLIYYEDLISGKMGREFAPLVAELLEKLQLSFRLYDEEMSDEKASSLTHANMQVCFQNRFYVFFSMLNQDSLTKHGCLSRCTRRLRRKRSRCRCQRLRLAATCRS